MKGPIYDYKNQRWTEIDTDTDRQTGPLSYVTPDGLAYELDPKDPAEYAGIHLIEIKVPNREG